MTDGSAHIHIGIPTMYLPAVRGLATAGPVSFIEAAARRATASGPMTGAAAGAWAVREPYGPRSLRVRAVHAVDRALLRPVVALPGHVVRRWLRVEAGVRARGLRAAARSAGGCGRWITMRF